MDTDIHCIHKNRLNIETDDIYKDVESRFGISNSELDGPLPKGKDRKVIVLMKNELCGKIMIKFVGLRATTYSYLTEDGSQDQKA